MQKLIYIWDSKDKPKIDSKFSVIFWSTSHEVSNESYSIVEILESNSDQLKSEYLHFIYNLGNSRYYGESLIDLLQIRDNFSFWWMTAIAEKNNWAKSPNISNILKLMALKSFFLNDECKQVVVKSDNKDLLSSIKLLCENLEINIKIISKNTSKINYLNLKDYIFNAFYLLKGALWLIREILFSIPFKLLGKKSWNLKNSKLIFVSYLSTVNLDDAKDKRFNNVFWGPLPSYLAKKQVCTNWLYLPSKRFRFYETLNIFFRLKSQKDSSHAHIIISSFFNLKVIYKTLKDIFIILTKFSKAKKELLKGSDFLWPLLKNDFSRSLLSSDMVSSLFYLALFEEVESVSDEDSKIIYLSENHSWEQGLISSFKSERRKLTGFAHSTIRYWDLRYFNDIKNYQNTGIYSKPIPDNFAVNGLNDKSMMIKFGYPDNKIQEVESLRYLYLNNLISKKEKSEKNETKTLLVLGDYLKSNTMFMLSFLKSNKVSRILECTNVIIKPHPACPIKSEDIVNINAKIEDSFIGNLILKADIVFTGNVSSAAVEAYSLGKTIISVRDLENLDMSPLRGVKNVKFVSDEENLKLTLNEALLNNENQQNIQFFNLDQDMTSWKEVLDL